MEENTASPWLPIGALLAAVAVVAGAFGAHALDAAPGSRPRELLETGSRYLMYAALGLMIVGLARERLGRPRRRLVGLSLASGSLIFFGTLLLMALGGPGWLGAVTPIGGVLMIAGFLVLAVTGWTRGRPG